METTEKIVEAYVRYVKGWATIPNIRCAGQHEIDLIAINPLDLQRYHIETSVSVSQSFSRLTTKAFDPDLYKKPVEKASQRRTLGFFIERKFGPTAVKEALSRYGFIEGQYRNVIVTWDWTPEALDLAQAAGIELWSFQELMREIADAIQHQRSYFGDDTLRTINLFVRALAAAEATQQPKRVRSTNHRKDNPGPSPPHTGTSPFWIYRNWIHRRARLHVASCAYCNDGSGSQGSIGNVTGEWLPFPDLGSATDFLSGVAYDDAATCGVCMKG